ncbi:hypothetical protein HDV02_003607 [Globomyces sp. JEL0801]|nr:hypothetical protein HDV02_003607 [Globomyces sp. JEL0801]
MNQKLVRSTIDVKRGLKKIINSDRIDCQLIYNRLQKKAEESVTPVHLYVQNDLYGWECLLEGICDDSRKLIDKISTFYCLGLKKLNGDAFLDNDINYPEVDLSLIELETSILLGALWVGNLNFNANGLLLKIFCKVLGTVRKMCLILDEVEQKQSHFNHFKIKNFLKSIQMGATKYRIESFKELAHEFVNQMTGLSKILAQIDHFQSFAMKDKTAADILTIEDLYYKLYGFKMTKIHAESAFEYKGLCTQVSDDLDDSLKGKKNSILVY